MLTPIDIQKQDFDVSFRGYNADEVDDFLDLVGTDYEKLYKDNIELRDKVSNLEAELEEYKKMDKALRDSILAAQTAAEDIRKTAEEKADNILKQTSEDMVTRRKELEGLQEEVDAYKAQIKNICARVVDLIDEME